MDNKVHMPACPDEHAIPSTKSITSKCQNKYLTHHAQLIVGDINSHRLLSHGRLISVTGGL